MSEHSEFHGAHACNYNNRPLFWNSKSLVDAAQLQLQTGQRLLDIGSGTGADLEKLHARYHTSVYLYGAEPSTDMMKQMSQAVSKSQNVHLSNAKADKLPYANDFFDYVMCSLVLHHMSDNDQQKALQEMYRVLKPGGRVLIKEWGKPRNIFGRVIAWFWRNHAHVRISMSMDLQLLLTQAGFKQVKILSVNRGVMYQLLATK